MFLTRLVPDKVNIKGYQREEKCDVTKIQICEIMSLDSICRKNKLKKKTRTKNQPSCANLRGDISTFMLWWLCSHWQCSMFNVHCQCSMLVSEHFSSCSFWTWQPNPSFHKTSFLWRHHFCSLKWGTTRSLVARMFPPKSPVLGAKTKTGSSNVSKNFNRKPLMTSHANNHTFLRVDVTLQFRRKTRRFLTTSPILKRGFW